jgi:hypothetical protein
MEDQLVRLIVRLPAPAIPGFIRRVIGNPADIANVWMQNDSSLPSSSRRNCRSVVDALSGFRRRKDTRVIIGV